MAEQDLLSPILRTKLRPPRVTSKIIRRARLNGLLDECLELPVTLVSAPAGYGKSTLVAEWLSGHNDPAAWLSLDPSDSEFPVFLRYFLATIESAVPGTIESFRAGIEFQNPPPAAAIAKALVNELDSLPHGLTLILDDYHLIHNSEVHELVTGLLRFPPASLHLIIITRTDPPLPFASMRAAGRLGEVRLKDLRFTPEEVTNLLSAAFNVECDDETAIRVHESTEGWPVALHLAALSLRDKTQIGSLLADHSQGAIETATDLAREILSQIPAEHGLSLLRLSVLDRFSAPLCQEVCSRSADSQMPEGSGFGFLQWLERSDLFVLSLDDDQSWYRFHHVFKAFLRRELETQRGVDEIAAIHRQAAMWLEREGLLDEAFDHYLAGGDTAAAAAMLRTNRHRMMDREQWDRIDRWLRSLPPESVRSDVELQVQRAWTLRASNRQKEIFNVLAEIQDLLHSKGVTGPPRFVLGEIEALRSFCSYILGHNQEAADLAESGIDHMNDQPHQTAFAHIIHAVAHQGLGEITHADGSLVEETAKPSIQGTAQHGRLLIGQCLIHWMEADVHRVVGFAKQILAIVKGIDLPESFSYASHFLGVCYADLGQLDDAAAVLRPDVEMHTVSGGYTKWYSGFLMVLIHQTRGEHERARHLMDSMVDRAVVTHDRELMAMCAGFEAELDLRQGRLGRALAWAHSFEPILSGPWWRWFLPELTLARALMAGGSSGNLRSARKVLTALEARFRETHNRRLLIDVLTLRASLAVQSRESAGGLKALEEAIELARSADVRRPFQDLSEDVIALALQWQRNSPHRSWIEEVRGSPSADSAASSAPQQPTPARPHQPLIEPLTNRELDVIELLAQRLTNKEIAARLAISPATVRTHTSKIYQKLGVSGRREAVARSVDIGVIRSS